MRLLVVGGTGYLGRRIIARSQFDTHATHQASHPRVGTVRWRRVDARDPEALRAAVDAVRPDAIVNCAYVQGGPDLAAVTVQCPAVLAAVAAERGIHLTHLSSDVIFPGRHHRPYVEADEPDPVHAYGHAKAAAEAATISRADALIVRTSLIYGGTEPGPQERLVFRAITQGDVEFFTDEVRSPIHVDDLADAILQLVERRHTGVLNVAGPAIVDRLTFAHRLAERMGFAGAALKGRTADPSLGPRPSNVALDIAKLRALLPGLALQAP